MNVSIVPKNACITIDELSAFLHENHPNLRLIPFPVMDMVFEERVKQKCFHCKNYGTKWTCPPHLPNVDYPKMFHEYENAAVIIYKACVTAENFETQRQQTTNIIHKALLSLEKYLYDHNNCMAISFIGGSCKLCKNGCNKEKCANPYLSRMPWEATGCNVIASLKKIGIEVSFPIKDTLYRYGLLLF